MYVLAISITDLIGFCYIGGFLCLKFTTVAKAVGLLIFCDSEGLKNTSWIFLSVSIILDRSLASL